MVDGWLGSIIFWVLLAEHLDGRHTGETNLRLEKDKRHEQKLILGVEDE